MNTAILLILLTQAHAPDEAAWRQRFQEAHARVQTARDHVRLETQEHDLPPGKPFRVPPECPRPPDRLNWPDLYEWDPMKVPLGCPTYERLTREQ